MGTLRTILGVGVVLAIASQVITGVAGKFVSKSVASEEISADIPTPVHTPPLIPRETKLAKIALTTEERNQVVKAATKGLSKTRDQIEKVTFYGPAGISSTRTEVGAYIGLEDTGNPYIRMKAAYSGDNWVFFEKIKIMVDDEIVLEKTFSRAAVSRDNARGRVWEIADFDAGANELVALEKIGRGKVAVIRYSGRQRTYDHKITSREKTDMTTVLSAYKSLQQKL